LQIFPVFYYI